MADFDTLLGITSKVTGQKPPSRAQEMNRMDLGPKQSDYWKHKERKELKAYEAANPGVNLTKGASYAQRAEVGLHPTEKDAIMQKIFGNDSEGRPNWRKNSTGDYIFKAPNGEEILFDERGLQWKDLADFTGSAIETAGAIGVGIAAAIFAPATVTAAAAALTWSGIVGLSILTAFGGQAAAGSVEVAAKYARDVPIDLEKTAIRRAWGTAWDAALGTFFGGLFKVFRGGAQTIVSPLAGDANAPANIAIRDAAKRVGEIPYAGIGPRANSKIELTPGQQLGSPILLRQESAGAKVPGPSGDMAKIMEAQETALNNAQGNVSGRQVSAMEVGEDILNQVDGAVKASQAQATAARGETEKAVHEGVESVREGMVTPRKSFDPEEATLLPSTTAVPIIEGAEAAGNVGVKAVLAKRDWFKNTAEKYYNQVRSLIKTEVPEGGSFIPTSNTKGEARNIIKDLMKEKDVVEDIPTGILDQFGRPITTQQVTPGKPSSAYMPPEVRRFLQGHEKLGETQTFEAIISARKIVYDAIQKGEGLPGISTRYLKKIGEALTKDLDAGIALAPGGKKGLLGSALDDASSFYKENAGQFQTPEIAGFFREASQAGQIDALGLIEKLSNGRGSVKLARQLRTMLKPDEWGQIRRGIFDDMLEKAQNNMAYDAFDPKTLYRMVRGLGPEMRKIVFGDDGKQILKLTKALEAKHGNLPLSVVRDYPNNLVGGLKKAAQIEAKERELFQNVILKKFVKGETGESSIQPDAFVRHMMESGNPAQIREVMELFSPELRSAIQDKAVQTILQDSYRKPTAMEVAKALSEGKPATMAQGDKFLELLQTGYGKDFASSEVRLNAIIGPERISQLKDIAIVSASRQRADQAAGAAGGLQAGMVIHQLMSGELIKGLSTVGKMKVVNLLMQVGWGKKWLMGGVTVPPWRGVGRSTIHAGPILDKIKTELANEPDALNQLLEKIGLDPTVTEQGQTGADFNSLQEITKESARRAGAGEAPVGVEPGGDPIADPTPPQAAPQAAPPQAAPQAAPQVEKEIDLGIAGRNTRTQKIFERIKASAGGNY